MEKGIIYSNDEAEDIYGSVIASETIDVSELRGLMKDMVENLMFKLKNNSGLVILGDERKPLLPSGYSLQDDEVFTSFSKKKVEELLSKGADNTAYVEIRNENILTITNRAYTLEAGYPCPPYCS